MLGLDVLFWMFIFFFGLIGLNRGWAKELLVTFAVILAIFIITVLQIFEPQIINALSVNNTTALFFFRASILVVLVFFAYQTPSISKLASNARFARERLQDALLGLFLGAINGYLVVGTLWYFLNVAQYPFRNIVTPPTPESSAAQLLALLPPEFLGVPVIYFAVAIAFAFILVVFL